MMEKVQRFGGAMFTPVLLFSFSGLMVSLAIICKNPLLVGSIAAEGTTWFGIWSVIEDGAWTVFNQMELLFVIGLPIGLAKKASARAVMEAFVIYLTFQYFVSGMLSNFSSFFGVDMSQEMGGTSGLKLIAGIPTLDTGIIGAIIISAIAVYIHNKFFDTKLPDFLGIFQGSSLVVIIGFFIMLPVAFLIALVWPKLQMGISSMQEFLAGAGVIGVWIYTFLERILIPTGLHHFVYSPFVYGPAVVPNGITKEWIANLNDFAASTKPIKELFPEGGFALHGNSKMFGSLGIAAAFYATSLKENKQKVLSILVPVTLTAFLAGITEPLEFTFLFISPILFVIHAVLAATMAATMYGFGVVGDMGGGFLDLLAKNWIPLFSNHKTEIFTQLIIGLIFSLLYFLLFRYLIIKWNLPTPGRELEKEGVQLFTKKDYKEKQKGKTTSEGNGSTENNPYLEQAAIYLEALGGTDNIEKVTNCATRLRVTVKNSELVATDSEFKLGGAHGVVRNGNALQVIVGLDVPQVREQFETLLKMHE